MKFNQQTTRFRDEERAALLRVKGVGPKVVERIEQLGISSFGALAARDPGELCAAVAARLGSTCWGNSPQARAAVAAAVAEARRSAPQAPAGAPAARPGRRALPIRVRGPFRGSG